MTTVFVPGQGDVEFPDSMSDEQISGVIKKQFPLLKGDSKEDLIGKVGTQQTPERGFLEKAVGAGEAGLSMATGMVAGPVGAAAGLARGLVSGKLGTQEGVQEGQEEAQKVSGALTYEPRTEAGKEALGAAGEVLDKLQGLPVADASFAGALSVGGVEGRTVANINARLQAAAENLKGQKEMVGVGAAQTEQAAIRRARAADLPVPIKLTKGQAERTFEQQQFERETAKHPETGAPLRERFAQQNRNILQNFEAWVDQTGAEAGSLRATGEAVTKAVVEKANSAKASIRAAYQKARESGDMSEKVDVEPLKGYLAGLEPESVNAGVISAASKKLESLAGEDGKLAINDLEEIRKMVGKLGTKDATNSHFAGEIKNQIDALTEGKGGDLYKRARAMHRRYSEEFKNVGVVNKLLSVKPGTTDRAVAYEDVFQHSILKGSLDDVRAIRKTLQTGGEKGQQAWKELQGATVKHLKDEITKNVATDQLGNPVVSPAKLNAMVNALDKDGKLDFIFGKKGAQQIRDVNDLAKDVYTAPPGSVNTSNTASILIGLLDTAVSGTAGMPLPIGTAINYAAKKVRMRAEKARVKEALDEPMLLKDYQPGQQEEQIPLKKAIGE